MVIASVLQRRIPLRPQGQSGAGCAVFFFVLGFGSRAAVARRRQRVTPEEEEAERRTREFVPQVGAVGQWAAVVAPGPDAAADDDLAAADAKPKLGGKIYTVRASSSPSLFRSTYSLLFPNPHPFSPLSCRPKSWLRARRRRNSCSWPRRGRSARQRPCARPRRRSPLASGKRRCSRCAAGGGFFSQSRLARKVTGFGNALPCLGRPRGAGRCRTRVQEAENAAAERAPAQKAVIKACIEDE